MRVLDDSHQDPAGLAVGSGRITVFSAFSRGTFGILLAT